MGRKFCGCGGVGTGMPGTREAQLNPHLATSLARHLMDWKVGPGGPGDAYQRAFSPGARRCIPPARSLGSATLYPFLPLLFRGICPGSLVAAIFADPGNLRLSLGSDSIHGRLQADGCQGFASPRARLRSDRSVARQSRKRGEASAGLGCRQARGEVEDGPGKRIYLEVSGLGRRTSRGCLCACREVRLFSWRGRARSHLGLPLPVEE